MKDKSHGSGCRAESTNTINSTTVTFCVLSTCTKHRWHKNGPSERHFVQFHSTTMAPLHHTPERGATDASHMILCCHLVTDTYTHRRFCLLHQAYQFTTSPQVWSISRQTCLKGSICHSTFLFHGSDTASVVYLDIYCIVHNRFSGVTTRPRSTFVLLKWTMLI